jgi:hypothetical protein
MEFTIKDIEKLAQRTAIKINTGRAIQVKNGANPHLMDTIDLYEKLGCMLIDYAKLRGIDLTFKNN